MLILVRHGRTAANAAGLLQGRVDNPLDEEGWRQAEAIAKAVGPVERVISSPLARARQTASAFGVDIEVDESWIELAYGEWEERPVRDVPAATWAEWRRDEGFAPPGGESLRELQDRVEGACARLAAEALERTIVVVTHVSPIKAAVAWALGVGPSTSWRMNVAQASMHRIRTGAPIPAVLSFNETAHLT